MERKLASIQKILSLEKIEGADKIEKATVLGWEVVVKKGDFKVGDLVVYCEVDSILPDRKEFEFLRERNFRIRTIKLKKQVSQGICFPLSIILEYFKGDRIIEIIEEKNTTSHITINKSRITIKYGINCNKNIVLLFVLSALNNEKIKSYNKTLRATLFDNYNNIENITFYTDNKSEYIIIKNIFLEGQDVTELIGVTKYETGYEKNERLQQEIKSGKVKKFFMKYNWFRRLFASDKMSWPSFISKTDEPRIQLFPNICEQEKDTVFSVTEKLDGQSATYFLVKNPNKWQFWKPYIFGVCSRNFLKGKKDNSTWWRIAEELKMEIILKGMIGTEDYIVIQGEIIGEGVQGNKYGIKGLRFYVFNIFTSKERLNNFSIQIECDTEGLNMVPIKEEIFKLKSSIPEMVEYAKGKSDIADMHREGIVVRNFDKNISFKVINPDFLLKYEE